MLLFPSENDKKIIPPTGQGYSKKKQTQVMANQHIFKSGLTDNTLNIFIAFSRQYKNDKRLKHSNKAGEFYIILRQL